MLDFTFADMHFVLADGSRRPAHKAYLAVQCETVKSSLNFARLQGTLEHIPFEFSLVDYSADVANAFIDYIYSELPTTYPDGVKFHMWIEMIKLAHYLRYIDTPSLMLVVSGEMDVAEMFSVARTLSIGELMCHSYLHDIDDLTSVLQGFSVEDIKWFAEVSEYKSITEAIVVSGIITRKTAEEQLELMRLLPDKLLPKNVFMLRHTSRNRGVARVFELLYNYMPRH